jgi:hypothetical protein
MRLFLLYKTKEENMKKLISKLIAVTTAMAILTQPITAEFGTPNADGAGGRGGGIGNNDNGWAVSSGNGGLIYDADGLRVSIVNATTGERVTAAIDITNYNIATTNVINGGQTTKNDYHRDASLDMSTAYDYVKVSSPPATPLPWVVPWEEPSNIENIKDWFTDTNNADWVFNQLGKTADEMKSGDYVLAFEPVLYFRHNARDYAVTATELSQLLQQDPSVRGTLGRLTGYLANSVYLEDDEFVDSVFRIGAWNGDTDSAPSLDDMFDYSGYGTINYAPDGGGGGSATIVGTATFAYPTDTWVITSFTLANVVYDTDTEKWVPGNPITIYNSTAVRFKGNFNTTEYVKGSIYIPYGQEQRVWVKWKTPPTPQTLDMKAEIVKREAGVWEPDKSKAGFHNPGYNGGNELFLYAHVINATITIYEKETENTPPDPTMEDARKEAAEGNFQPDAAQTSLNTRIRNSPGTKLTWYVWNCEATPTANDPYKCKFIKETYMAWLDVYEVELKPSIRSKTASGSNGNYVMKSGYGVEIVFKTRCVVEKRVEGVGGASQSSYFSNSTSTSPVTNAQIVDAYFPEFYYETYWRQLETVGGTYDEFDFTKNEYSTYDDRVHYTPVWYPDDLEYRLLLIASEAYTPMGKLKVVEQTNPIMIKGNMWDDWHVAATR